jgi:hypothetical protein
MKILAAIKNVFALVAIVLLNSIGTAGHASAMSTMSHEMSGMNHSSSDASSCATLCRTAVLNKEDTNINREDDEDDDKLATVLYAQSQTLLTDYKSVTQRLYADTVKPPPKVPIYIRYAVFRV